jgi:hypothetical protein
MNPGHPQWLWPEVAQSDWRASLREIERVTRAVLSGQADELRPKDECAFKIAAYTSGMGPLLGYWIAAGSLGASGEVASSLGKNLRHNSVRMRKMAARAVAATHSLSRVGISPVILKGMQTAFVYFPESGTRPLSDIDILIEEHEAGRSGEALHDAGFRLKAERLRPHSQVWNAAGTRTEPRTLSFVHALDPWSVDLQLTLNRRHLTGVVDLDVMRAGAGAPWALSAHAKVLSAAEQFLHLAIHTTVPLNSMTLLRLVELILVWRLEASRGELTADALIEKAKRFGVLGTIHPSVLVASRLLPGCFPDSLLQACERAALPKVRRIAARLAPGDAQRIRRTPVNERYMWSPRFAVKFRHLLADLADGCTFWRARLRCRQSFTLRLLFRAAEKGPGA